MLKTPVLNALRRATNSLILIDPSTITLIPHKRVAQGGGVWKVVPQTPREPQTFLVEPTANAVVNSEGSQAHSWTYRLTGRWNAEIEIDDQWQNGETTYRVTSLEPENGYEKVAVITALGKDPAYG